MKLTDQNIFKTARENAGFTQEQVAEILDVSVKTISNWECYNFKTIADKKILKMSVLYKSTELPWQWLKMFSAYKDVLPDVEFRGIESSIIHLQDAFNDFDGIIKNLFKIMKDGRIDETEQEEWISIKEVSKTMASALLSMIAQCDKE